MDKLIHRICLTTEEMQSLIDATDNPELQKIRTKINKALEAARAEEAEQAREADQFADFLKQYFPQPKTQAKTIH